MGGPTARTGGPTGFGVVGGPTASLGGLTGFSCSSSGVATVFVREVKVMSFSAYVLHDACFD